MVRDAAALARELGEAVGDDGSGELRFLVDFMLADDPDVTLVDLIEIVLEAREDAVREHAVEVERWNLEMTDRHRRESPRGLKRGRRRPPKPTRRSR